MSLFDIFKRKKTLNDYIEYYELTNWWQNRFNEEEREIILNIYNNSSLTKEELFGTNKNSHSFLISMYKLITDNETIKNKVEGKVFDCFDPLDKTMILDMHYFYEAKITSTLSEKELVGACYTHINFAPRIAQVLKSPLPSHKGYDNLCEVLEKEKKYEELKKIASKALAQGWAGDWQTIINKYEAK